MQCYKIATRQEIAALFERWNNSLKSGDPKKVVANYAEQSILLPTVSNKPRLSQSAKEKYFRAFLKNKPTSTIDLSFIELGGNIATDSGVYTFTYNTTGRIIRARYSFIYRWSGTEWLIACHHSSAMPEE